MEPRELDKRAIASHHQVKDDLALKSGATSMRPRECGILHAVRWGGVASERRIGESPRKVGWPRPEPREPTRWQSPGPVQALAAAPGGRSTSTFGDSPMRRSDATPPHRRACSLPRRGFY